MPNDPFLPPPVVHDVSGGGADREVIGSAGPDAGAAPEGAHRPHRPSGQVPVREAALAVAVVAVLLGGVARVATRGGTTPVASGTATAVAGAPDPSTVPAPVSSPVASVAGPLSSPPSPPPAYDPDPNLDLQGRVPTFDPTQATDDAAAARGFTDLGDFVAAFPAAEQARQRQLLVGEKFEGAFDELLDGAATDRVYRVSESRFATAAGAAKHQLGFVDGPAGSAGRLHLVATTVPDTRQFQGPSTAGDLHEEIAYTVSGRYFAEIIVASPAAAAAADTAVDRSELAQILGSVRAGMG